MPSLPDTFVEGFHLQHDCSRMPYVNFIGLTVSKIGFGIICTHFQKVDLLCAQNLPSNFDLQVAHT